MRPQENGPVVCQRVVGPIRAKRNPGTPLVSRQETKSLWMVQETLMEGSFAGLWRVKEAEATEVPRDRQHWEAVSTPSDTGYEKSYCSPMRQVRTWGQKGRDLADSIAMESSSYCLWKRGKAGRNILMAVFLVSDTTVHLFVCLKNF